jgi:hypothetical protein
MGLGTFLQDMRFNPASLNPKGQKAQPSASSFQKYERNFALAKSQRRRR